MKKTAAATALLIILLSSGSTFAAVHEDRGIHLVGSDPIERIVKIARKWVARVLGPEITVPKP